MQVLLKLNDDELKLMTEEEFEKMKDELDEFDGIHPYIIMGWLHDKKPICNMCNDYLDDDSRPLDQQVSREVACTVQDPIFEKLEKEFAEVINRNSIENWNNTPDFILAKYLIDCLKVFSDINRNREQWYGKELKII